MENNWEKKKYLLDIIQKNIKRFEKICFKIKATSITLITIFVPLILKLNFKWIMSFSLILILLILMIGDIKYLNLSRHFCNIWTKIIKKETLESSDFDLRLKKTKEIKKEKIKKIVKDFFWSWSITPFYLILMIILFVLALFS